LKNQKLVKLARVLQKKRNRVFQKTPQEEEGDAQKKFFSEKILQEGGRTSPKG